MSQAKTTEQRTNEKLERVRNELKQVKKRNRAAYRLLDRALDQLPDFMDGRNDKLCDSIAKWLDEPQA